jgi:hypothetical protein
MAVKGITVMTLQRYIKITLTEGKHEFVRKNINSRSFITRIKTDRSA